MCEVGGFRQGFIHVINDEISIPYSDAAPLATRVRQTKLSVLHKDQDAEETFHIE